MSPPDDILSPYVDKRVPDWSALMARVDGLGRKAVEKRLNSMRREAGTLWKLPARNQWTVR